MHDEPYPPDETPLSQVEVRQVFREVRHLIGVRPIAARAAYWSLIPSIVVVAILSGLAAWSITNDDPDFAVTYGAIAGFVLSVSLAWFWAQRQSADKWERSKERAFADLQMILRTTEPIEEDDWFEAAELMADLMRPDEFYYHSPRTHRGDTTATPRQQA